MKKITLKDSFRVSDSKITGYVVIKENGKIIIKKENMIVETGRKYIKDLVHNKIIGSGSEARKINSVKFGTGINPVVSSNTSLQTVQSTYDMSLTTLGWKKIASAEGPTNPTLVVIGNYFYNTSDDELLIGTSGEPNTWEEVLNYTTGTTLPTTSLTEGHFFYNTSAKVLYVYGKTMVISQLNTPDIGLKIDIYLTGKSEDRNISELGLFLDGSGTEMFSRLVFNAIPLTNNNTYEISYYIYF
jgi:hypothetical protein